MQLYNIIGTSRMKNACSYIVSDTELRNRFTRLYLYISFVIHSLHSKAMMPEEFCTESLDYQVPELPLKKDCR